MAFFDTNHDPFQKILFWTFTTVWDDEIFGRVLHKVMGATKFANACLGLSTHTQLSQNVSLLKKCLNQLPLLYSKKCLIRIEQNFALLFLIFYYQLQKFRPDFCTLLRVVDFNRELLF
jgi:hypothetical protein